MPMRRMWSFPGHVHVGAGDMLDTEHLEKSLYLPAPLGGSLLLLYIGGRKVNRRGLETQGQVFLFLEEMYTRAGFNLGLKSGLFYN